MFSSPPFTLFNPLILHIFFNFLLSIITICSLLITNAQNIAVEVDIPLSAPPVQPSRPGKMTGGVVFVGPLFLQHGFSFAVSLLLFPIGLQVVATMVPIHSSGVESQASAVLLQSPTHIDIIACGAIANVKTINRCESVATKCHIAARNMFGFCIGYQHVYGAATIKYRWPQLR